MKYIKMRILISFTAIQGTLMPYIVGAAALTNPLQAQDVRSFLLNIIDIMLTFAIPVSVLAIMYGGFQLVMASGNEKNIGKAKDTLTWAIAGAVVIFASKLILGIIISTIKSI